MTVSPERHKFLLLDVLRGLAAVLVVGRHIPDTLNKSLVPFGSYLCVDLFFCLSGFVIAYSYQDRLADRMDFSSFSLARLIRLYPLYFLGLLLGACFKLMGIVLTLSGRQEVYPGPGLLQHFISAFGMAVLFLPSFSTSRVAATPFSFNPPSWSLFYELVANFVFAMLVRRRLASNASVVGLMTLCLGVLSVWSLIYATTLDNGVLPGTYSIGFARVGYSFFAGVLLFRIYRAGVRIEIKGLSLILTTLVLLTGTGILLAIRVPKSIDGIYGLAMIGIIIPTIVWVAACCNVGDRFRPTAALMGEVSYPLYVIHMPLLFFVAAASKSRPGWALSPYTALLLIPMLCLLSFWISRNFDRPIRMALNRRLSQKRALTSPLPAVADVSMS
ncbi:peptidoglycan/LPS O-acetylase OafA/YrhL [Silvibacterium bohemicum]|uniref:Peptidoglycan/LPS O-acetylase OafA/YrhL n=1 Tax=Silvibacterium bohemicum TaxID=1577686 RepID=A0A841JW49_9BACT|nr:acyltransferase [Silvibacterium bohemicum]MBB6144775.1 peptidoglycan/LPS O-acetylase OafA/YrhL [Silvibacterium bohemicum]